MNLLVMFFGFLITDLPCHVVTLQSDVRVIYGYYIQQKMVLFKYLLY